MNKLDRTPSTWTTYTGHGKCEDCVEVSHNPPPGRSKKIRVACTTQHQDRATRLLCDPHAWARREAAWTPG